MILQAAGGGCASAPRVAPDRSLTDTPGLDNQGQSSSVLGNLPRTAGGLPGWGLAFL